MRILHTSDWHLGRSFGPISLRTDQERFCDRIVEIATAEGVDLVVVAGDIYDRAIAPNEAIDLFRETVRRLLGAGAVVAAITGNHDGSDRVAPYDDLLDRSGFYLRGGYEGVGRIVTHRFADGPLDLVLLPFLDPQMAPDDHGEVAGDVVVGDVVVGDVEDALERRRRRTHDSVLHDAIGRALPGLVSPRSVAVAHAFVEGGSVSDSERQLEVGGTGAVRAELFEPFSYTALGHLHRPQSVGGSATLRYSGTPLSYSFSEAHDKSVTIVDMAPDGACTTTDVPLGICRGVTTLRGPIDDLLEVGRYRDAVGRFVRAIVTDRGTVLDAKARLEAVYPHVVEIRLEPEGAPDRPDDPAAPIAELSPMEATLDFWEAIEGSPPDADLAAALQVAVEAAVRGSA